MSSPHDQYYDEDRRRWADSDPDYNPSIQELAWGPGLDDPDNTESPTSRRHRDFMDQIAEPEDDE